MSAGTAPNIVFAAFAELKVKLPLRMSDEDMGVILDDDGVDVITIDVNGTRTEGQVELITALVVETINVMCEPEERYHA